MLSVTQIDYIRHLRDVEGASISEIATRVSVIERRPRSTPMAPWMLGKEADEPEEKPPWRVSRST